MENCKKAFNQNLLECIDKLELYMRENFFNYHVRICKIYIFKKFLINFKLKK